MMLIDKDELIAFIKSNGFVYKVSNELKQDSVFKAKMSLAVANVVNECLTDRSIYEKR